MQEESVVPELKTIGCAAEVILGSTAVGNDIGGEILVPEFEFEKD